MVEHYGGRVEDQRNEYQQEVKDNIKNNLDAGSSSSDGTENNDIINEINNSGDSIGTINKMIDDDKDISYIIKSLKSIVFSKNSDPEYRKTKNSEAKKQIAEKVFNKEGGWKIVLDNWESFNDLTYSDKQSRVDKFKNMVEKSPRKPNELADRGGSNSDSGQIVQTEWKDDYYDYLENNSSFKFNLEKDREASVLFGDILTEKMKAEDDKFEQQLSEMYGTPINGLGTSPNDSENTLGNGGFGTSRVNISLGGDNYIDRDKGDPDFNGAPDDGTEGGTVPEGEVDPGPEEGDL